MFARKMMFAVLIALLAVAVAGPAQADGNAAKGKELSAECIDCHGENGLGDDTTPPIAGMNELEIDKILHDFKSGARPDPDDTMQIYTEDLSDQDMADLAAYWASLPGK